VTRAPGNNLLRQTGAALLSAMLTVTLVAALASAALWQQFRSLQVETAERSRLQSSLILTGALDWARLILREDARTGGADYLAEPWAVPLEEARLSSFLAVDGTTSDTDTDAFLSGSIIDMQSRLNVVNLVDGAVLSETGFASFQRLFDRLDLSPQTLKTFADNYLEATKTANAASAVTSANQADWLLPQRPDQLAWLGLDATTLAVLAPHITILPARTPVNLNTASAMVLISSALGLDLAGAEKLIAARSRKHFSTLADASQALGNPAVAFTDGSHSVASRFFEVRGQLRLEDLTVFERSLVQRDGLSVRTLWRVRGVSNDAPNPAGADTGSSASVRRSRS
jgi:general secretion pathway protein K